MESLEQFRQWITTLAIYGTVLILAIPLTLIVSALWIVRLMVGLISSDNYNSTQSED